LNFKESQLITYATPLSATEEERCKNAIRMIRDAMKLVGYTDNNKEIRSYETDTWAFSLDLHGDMGKKIVLLVQGSYANNTNIRTQSDVDVAVILESTFIPEYRIEVTKKSYNFTDGTFTAQKLKDEVESALKRKFNGEGVERKDKSIKVHGNSYRVDADVVPAYRFRDYREDYHFDANNYVGGIEIRPDSGGNIINYPEQHIKNGRAKNNATNYCFKKHVRIMKKMKQLMLDYEYSSPKNVSSFGLESLLWNIPNAVYAKYPSVYRYTFDELIIHLRGDFDNFGTCKEANGIKTLFPTTSDRENYKTFIIALSDFYQYDIQEA